MKKYLLAIFTLLVICNLTSASNWDLLKPGKRWNVVLTGLSPDGEKINYTTYFYKFESDTIINSLKYLRAWESMDENFNSKTLTGFVKEDSLIGFYFRNLDGVESLIYKYNLHIGDSLSIINPFIPCCVIRYSVKNIDLVLINGKNKKSYTMEQQNQLFTPETWIEGIGSSFGILNSGMATTGGVFHFLCYYENNIMLYRNPEYSECYYSTKTSIQPVKDSGSGIKLYSGVNHNIVNIKSAVDNSVRIYNSCGMYVETFNVLANQEYSLNVSSYPKGIYFVSTSTNLSGSKKFIKY